jgi:deoxyinosine 3'endonuclease (endonuclease V)
VKPWSVREWTCEECTDIMTRVGDYMNQKDTIDQAVQLMQGQYVSGYVRSAQTS